MTAGYSGTPLARKLSLKDGMVALPSGPGLGIEVDEAAVERFRVR